MKDTREVYSGSFFLVKRKTRNSLQILKDGPFPGGIGEMARVNIEALLRAARSSGISFVSFHTP